MPPSTWRGAFLDRGRARAHTHPMLLDPFYVSPYGDPNALTDRTACRIMQVANRSLTSDLEMLELAGAAKVLGSDHSATKAFAKAPQTMDRVDLWRARLAMKTLSKDQRAAIAAAADIVI